MLFSLELTLAGLGVCVCVWGRGVICSPLLEANSSPVCLHLYTPMVFVVSGEARD